MTPDWQDAPEWAQWVARDYDGEWHWFLSKPIMCDGLWHPEHSPADPKQYAMSDNVPPLCERPSAASPAKAGGDEREAITDEQIESEARLYSLDLANGLDWGFDDFNLKAFVRSLLNRESRNEIRY